MASDPILGPAWPGVRVVLSDDLPQEWERVQVRRPRSKRKRIRRKWSKNPRNWRRTLKPAVYQIGTMLVVNAPAYAALMAALGADNA